MTGVGKNLVDVTPAPTPKENKPTNKQKKTEKLKWLSFKSWKDITKIRYKKAFESTEYTVLYAC